MDRAEENLAERCREFVALLARHDRALFHFILSLVPNYADAEELSQQVRLLLWEQFSEYDPSKDFGKWSRAIARYKIFDYRKQSARQHALLSDTFLAVVSEQAERSSAQVDAHFSALRNCLQQLDRAKRELVMHYYSGNASMRELAEQLGRSADSVRHSILRTRKALALCVERALQREGER